MPDLRDGETALVQGSAREPYILKNVGGVYSCTCPAWRHQSLPIERRSCKHLRQWLGEAAEAARLGQVATPQAAAPSPKQVPALLLAEIWDGATDVTDWFLSEKLDGVRAYWDGQRFWSRQGSLFHAPAWFTRGLPAAPLDGELWLGRRAFQRTISIVRRHDATELWREVRYQIFDAPQVAGSFEERLAFLHDCFASAPCAFAAVLSQVRCRGDAHLQAELERIVSGNGEGLMLREPGSRYETGRSPTLLKVKRFHDAEARVIDHLPGAGRHKGRLGALLVELADGVTFSVGTGLSDKERDNPPPIGSTITFRYQELSDRGVPRFPSFVRVRTDAPSGDSQWLTT